MRPGSALGTAVLSSTAPAPLNPITLFSSGETGYVFDPATISSLRQDIQGLTLVTAAGDSVGLDLSIERWAGQTFTPVMAAQAETQTDSFSTPTWVINDGLSSITDGVLHLLSTSITGGASKTAANGSPYNSAKAFEVVLTVTDYVKGGVRVWTGAGYTPGFTANGVHSFIAAAPADTTVRVYGSTTDNDLKCEISIKEIPSVPSRQATPGAQPKYQTGPVRIVGDGIDDDLLTTFNPTLEGTIWFAGMIENASDVLMGSQPASEGRCFIGTNAAGELCGAVGEQGFSVITGGPDIRGQYGVFFLDYDGSDVALSIGAETIYEGAQVGAVNTTIPDRVLSLNNNGAGASFSKAAFVGAGRISRRITPAERAGVTAYYDL
jgi:hypothetical protein